MGQLDLRLKINYYNSHVFFYFESNDGLVITLDSNFENIKSIVDKWGSDNYNAVTLWVLTHIQHRSTPLIQLASKLEVLNGSA